MLRLRFHEPGTADGAEGEPAAWLTAAERERLLGLFVARRRRDWLLGRSTAKRLVASAMEERFGAPLPLSCFEILPDPSGAPAAHLAPLAPPYAHVPPGGRLPADLSISHSRGAAFCAVLVEDGAVSVGADLEAIEPRSQAFVHDFFTPSEAEAWQARTPGRARDVFANATWSAKESVLKALKLGLTVDARGVECTLLEIPGGTRPAAEGWKTFTTRCAPGIGNGRGTIEGLWREERGFVLTLAVEKGGRAARPPAGVPSGSPPERKDLRLESPRKP